MKRQPLGDLLSDLESKHLARRRTTIDGFVEPGNRVTTTADGRTLVDFSSNDYLGLAHHPAIAAAMSACAARTVHALAAAVSGARAHVFECEVA